jgi:hypothetical protein
MGLTIVKQYIFKRRYEVYISSWVNGLLKVVDTTVRDGQQSLFATRMKTDDILPILEKMDDVGFYGMEGGSGHIRLCIGISRKTMGETEEDKRSLKKDKVVMLLWKEHVAIGTIRTMWSRVRQEVVRDGVDSSGYLRTEDNSN